jgi:single-strand DNA-binding protein
MLNKIQLIGHLGRDPHITVTRNGKTIARFSLGVSRPRSQHHAAQPDDTQWFTIVAWEWLAETCERLLHTGAMVYIEGRIGSHTYADRDGVERTAWEVTASDIQLLDRRRPSGSQEQGARGADNRGDGAPAQAFRDARDGRGTGSSAAGPADRASLPGPSRRTPSQPFDREGDAPWYGEGDEDGHDDTRAAGRGRH